MKNFSHIKLYLPYTWWGFSKILAYVFLSLVLVFVSFPFLLSLVSIAFFFFFNIGICETFYIELNLRSISIHSCSDNFGENIVPINYVLEPCKITSNKKNTWLYCWQFLKSEQVWTHGLLISKSKNVKIWHLKIFPTSEYKLIFHNNVNITQNIQNGIKDCNPRCSDSETPWRIQHRWNVSLCSTLCWLVLDLVGFEFCQGFVNANSLISAKAPEWKPLKHSL